MSSWVNIFPSLPWLRRSAIHLVDQNAESLLRGILQQLGFDIIDLVGRGIRDESTFFKEAKRAFGFPAYFGYNWDAFGDSFGALSLGRERSLAVLWVDAHLTVASDLRFFIEAVHYLLSNTTGQKVRAVDQLQVTVFFLGHGELFSEHP